jgi:hypothetical protein
MKTNISKFAFVYLLLILSISHGQSIDFVYHAPRATMVTTFGAGNVRSWARLIERGVPVTRRDTIPVMQDYRWVRLNSSNIANFRSIAPANILKTYDSLVNNSVLKRKVDNTTRISGENVRMVIHLVDDRTGLHLNEGYVGNSIDRADGKKYIWPAARNYLNSALVSTGEIYMGEHYSTQIINNWEGNWKRWESVILHEVSHTQRRPDPRGANTWGEMGTTMSYGPDGTHFLHEIQGSEESALDEALGSFWGMTHYQGDSTRIIRFLTDTTSRFDIERHSPLSAIHEIWNAPHVSACAGPVAPESASSPFSTSTVCPAIRVRRFFVPDTSQYEIRKYKWRDVPGRYMMNNENMAQAYLYLFWKHGFANMDTAFNKIRNTARILYTSRDYRNWHVAFFANSFAYQMERYVTTPSGQADLTNNRLISSMFAIAIYDLLRNFSGSNIDFEADIRNNTFSNGIPFAMETYKNHRNAIKTLVQSNITANSININAAVGLMKNYFKNPSTILRQ